MRYSTSEWRARRTRCERPQIARRRTEEEQAEAFFPLRATTAADSKRDAASSARKGDILELAARFFLGHGPASIQDLARWSSLTIGQCRDALDVIKDQLGCISVEGVELWFDPAAPSPGPVPGALLMPLYDELTLSYPVINFPQSTGHPHRPGEDLFVGSVIISETNVGLWRRTLRGRKMIMEITVSAGCAAKISRYFGSRGRRPGNFSG